MIVKLKGGDSLFLPEGYWHQISSSSGTIAVNIWWRGRYTNAPPHLSPYLIRMELTKFMQTETEKLWQTLRDQSSPPRLRDVCFALRLHWAAENDIRADEDMGSGDCQGKVGGIDQSECALEKGEKEEVVKMLSDPFYFPGVLLASDLAFWKTIIQIASASSRFDGLRSEVVLEMRMGFFLTV
jgi:hypothetical protein